MPAEHSFMLDEVNLLMTGVMCPKGCGELQYKNQLTRVGSYLTIGGVAIIILGIMALGGSGDYSILILGITTVCVIAWKGPKLSLLRCADCYGAMLESKSIDKFLDREANYFRKELMKSEKSSDYDCPDCRKKMRMFQLYLKKNVNWGTDAVLFDLLSNRNKEMEIDGCSDCDIIWLDRKEEAVLDVGDHKIIRNG